MAERITEENIGEAEKETIRIASGTLSALESALASWEALKEKPWELEEKFKKYEWLRCALEEWMKKMLQAQGDSGSLEARQKRLSEFAKICRQYKVM
ncbi:MAG: hypothetical protein AB1324_02235 [Candidatus Micrarchaeota archaeon]